MVYHSFFCFIFIINSRTLSKITKLLNCLSSVGTNLRFIKAQKDVLSHDSKKNSLQS